MSPAFPPPYLVPVVVGAMGMEIGIVVVGMVVFVADVVVAAVMEIMRCRNRSYRHTTGKTWEYAGVVRRNARQHPNRTLNRPFFRTLILYNFF
jgi:hypothetical protein